MRDALTIVLPGEQRVARRLGPSLLELSKEFEQYYRTPVVAAIMDNELKELAFRPDKPGLVEFLDLYHPEGMRIYQRSLTYLLIMAAKELFPKGVISIEHSLGKGIYCELYKEPVLTREDVAALENKMKELVAQDLPIIRERWPLDRAIAYFRKEGLEDKARLLKYREKTYLNMYCCKDFRDYLYGYLVPSTGYLKTFRLRYHMPGLILELPDDREPFRVPPFVERPKLFTIFREAEQWARILGVATAGALNDRIQAGEGEELVRLNEALHEKKVAQIADDIYRQRDRLRVILIAGPSSSGKTTFAQRLSIQLKVNGMQPISISLDDYFVDRESTPRDENGQYDFEALEAIDLQLFNEQLTAIIQGKKVEVPSYNFKLGKREYLGRTVQIGPEQPIIIEGIHGLNERLTASIPRDRKYKIYISAITALNIDRHNRIPTTDVRLLRRIVRDSQFRGHNAAATLRLWPMVRRGEERNIFPFQEEADIMFNSALVYELALLKKYAEPLLQEIDSSMPEYIAAKRLLRFLECFVPLGDVEIPCTSIIKEFVGGSCLVE
ncbi:MAG TPA: nucleoside kinase [Clostridia bacterium]|nr:nucleoside kinase [Clostridia bacterium]